MNPAKRELITPAKNDAFATLKTVSNSVATIHINENLKNKSSYEYPSNPKLFNVKTSTLLEWNLEKLEELDSLVSKVENLAHDVEILKIRTTPLQGNPT